MSDEVFLDNIVAMQPGNEFDFIYDLQQSVERISNYSTDVAISDVLGDRRAVNQLSDKGYVQVNQLADIVKHYWTTGLCNIQYRTLVLLTQSLHSYDPNNNFIEFDSYIDQLKERDKKIICDRYGLIGERKTLEETGEVYRLTRERIRQIQARVVNNLQRLRNRINPEVISTLQSSAMNLTPIEDIPAISDNYQNTGSVEILVDAFPDLELSFFASKYLKTKLLIFKAATDELIQNIYQLIEFLWQAGSAVDIALAAENAGLPEHVVTAIRDSEIREGKIKLTKNRVSAMSKQDLVIEAMRDFGRPMSITQIMFKSGLDFNQVRGIVGRSGTDIVNIGRSKYALEEQGYKHGSSGELAVQFLKECNAPQTVRNIINYVNQYREVKEASIYAALKKEPDIVQVGWRLYGLKSWE